MCKGRIKERDLIVHSATMFAAGLYFEKSHSSAPYQLTRKHNIACDLCGKGFGLAQSLKWHKQNNHNNLTK